MLWALCALQLYDSPTTLKLVQNFNKYTFERIDHDLKFEEFAKFIDIINAMKLEGPKHLQITNQTIVDGFVGREMYYDTRFPESQAVFDPFKKRVVGALA